MTELKLIVFENVPCWYELSWDKDELGIILRINKKFIENLNFDLEKSPIVKSLMKNLELINFSGDFSADIGFDSVFKRIGEKDGFIEFMVKIPQVKKETGKKCKDCNGSGINEDLGRECLFCEGTGEEHIMDWKAIEKISASFTVFTTFLMYCKVETDAPYYQLLTVQTITTREMHGGSLGGGISIPMHNWLRSFDDMCEIPEMLQAMKTAYNQMVGLRDYHKFSFNAYVNSGKFITSCPGDACGLHPSNWHADKDEGYEFDCHNVDSAIQQLTLLAGLVALHDRARKEINKTTR